jgi:hypothetical protein
MGLFRHSGRGDDKTTRADSASRRSARESVRIGAYLHSAQDLYRVEGVSGERALVEDCRSGDLIDVSWSELLRLEPVRSDGGRAPRTA